MNNASKLPDSYSKHRESNNYKLLNINEQAIEVLKTDTDAVLNVLDIMQATGKTLELYGEMVGQKRGELTDLQYKYMIMTRIGINITDGTYSSFLNIACRILECDPSEIVIDDAEEPCSISLTKFPLIVLINAGFTGAQAVAMIEMLLPVGVSIGSSNFEGTFEFAESYGEYDESAGFGDINQTIGGYFGLTTDSGNAETILPI